MAASIGFQLLEGLSNVDRSPLPGKFKVWCNQFTLYQRLMWPLKLCYVSLATAQKLDSKTTTLKLPLESLSLGYRQEKVRLLFKLRDLPDPAVRNAKVHVHTGHKWDAAKAVDQAITCLKHLEVVRFQ